MPYTLPYAQRQALKELFEAIKKAGQTGLWNSTLAWQKIGPKVINHFCDGVGSMIESEGP